jgi:hypothetical protein
MKNQKAEKQELRRQFNKVLRAAKKHTDEKVKLDVMIEECYGWHYSNFNIDEIIDALDKGIHTMSFNAFDAIMERGNETD